MIRPILAAILATTVMAGSAGAETAQHAPDCPKEEGRIKGPYVPTKDAAAKIYLAVGQAMSPKAFPALRKKYPIVDVEDDGDKWQMGQSSHSSKPRGYKDKQGNEFIVVTAGGGMLNMSIDKCTGAISEMSFAR
jgi:hypothetical protein